MTDRLIKIDLYFPWLSCFTIKWHGQQMRGLMDHLPKQSVSQGVANTIHHVVSDLVETRDSQVHLRIAERFGNTSSGLQQLPA